MSAPGERPQLDLDHVVAELRAMRVQLERNNARLERALQLVRGERPARPIVLSPLVIELEDVRRARNGGHP